MNCTSRTQEPQVSLRITTWEDNSGLCVGFEAALPSQRFRTRHEVNLNQEETRELLAWEEKCNGLVSE